MRPLPLAVAAALLAAALLATPATAAAAASRPVPAGPAGDAFYVPPAPLPGRRHGDLIRARRLTGAAALSDAARNELLLYRSKGLRGKAVAVSGTVAIPRGRAPRGGWPVVTYAHSTTGLGDRCAPTRDRVLALVHLFNAYAYPLLERWLRAGFAVVRTDYVGLGTPGPHPYLDGPTEARAVLDAVRAARTWNRRLSRRVVVAGHSQGGQAALWAASAAPRWARGLDVRGTVAFAPVSHLGEQAALLPSLTTPAANLSGLAALILRGVDIAHPGLHVARLLSPRAAELWPETLTACLPAPYLPTSFGGLTPAELLKPGAELAPVVRALRADDPERLRIRTPVRVEQGEADTTVAPALTDRLVAAYRAHRVPVGYATFPGVGHAQIVDAAAADATRWMRSRLR